MEDDRIKAGINIDGFLPGKSYLVNSTKPLMEIKSRDNYTGPTEGFLKIKKEGNRTEVVFLKANHFSFTDLPLSFPVKPLTAPYIRKIHKELNALTLDFFNRSLGAPVGTSYAASAGLGSSPKSLVEKTAARQ